MITEALKELLLDMYFGRLNEKNKTITIGFDEEGFEIVTRALRDEFNKYGLKEMKGKEVKSNYEVTKYTTNFGSIKIVKLSDEKSKGDRKGREL